MSTDKWQPPQERVKLASVTKGYEWKSGTPLVDATTGRTLLLVRHQGHYGDIYAHKEDTAGKYICVLSDPATHQTLAVVVRLYGKQDFGIFTIRKPNFPQQQSTRLISRDGFYLHGVIQTGFWGNQLLYKKCTGDKKKDFITICKGKWVAQRGKSARQSSGRRLSIPQPNWSITMKNEKNQVVLTRDQKMATVELSPSCGVSLVEAACVSYALDRLTSIQTEELALIGHALVKSIKKNARDAA